MAAAAISILRLMFADGVKERVADELVSSIKFGLFINFLFEFDCELFDAPLAASKVATRCGAGHAQACDEQVGDVLVHHFFTGLVDTQCSLRCPKIKPGHFKKSSLPGRMGGWLGT